MHRNAGCISSHALAPTLTPTTLNRGFRTSGLKVVRAAPVQEAASWSAPQLASCAGTFGHATNAAS